MPTVAVSRAAMVSSANRIGMCSRDSLTATCWKWLIFAGSVRLNTEPTPARASASVICPSERSWSCCSFSSIVICPSRLLTLRSIPGSAVWLAGWSALSSLDCGAAPTPPTTSELSATIIATVTVLRPRGPMAPPPANRGSSSRASAPCPKGRVFKHFRHSRSDGRAGIHGRRDGRRSGRVGGGDRGGCFGFGGVVAEPVLEQREGAVAEPAEVGGELNLDVVGWRAGLGRDQPRQGVGGAGDRPLLARQQRRAGGDHPADGAQPLQRLGVTGLDLGQQAAGLEQVAAEGGERWFPRLARADRFQQACAEGLQLEVEEVLLGPEVVENGRLGNPRLARDLGHGHAVEATVGEQPPGGFRDQPARLLFLQLAKSHGPLVTRSRSFPYSLALH